MSSMHPLIRLVIAAIVAVISLIAYGWNDISAEDFALQKQEVHKTETISGIPFTAASVSAMKEALHNSLRAKRRILWLGNSQLHTINQMKNNDHLASYWLLDLLRPFDAVPVTFSLPNANLQEHWVLTAYALRESRLDMILVGLVFDDLREDDLRPEFRSIMDRDLRSALASTEFGERLVSRFTAQSNESGSGDETTALDGFGQRWLEKSMTSFLTDRIPLWARRPTLRTHLLTDLYFARNFVFGIKSTTVRHVIPIRYTRNMTALEELLKAADRCGVPVVGYIAPLRRDVKAPYDEGEYRAWKAAVQTMLQAHNAHYLNLEAVVPGGEWGAYDGDEIDFMHFQGTGHRILAAALYPEVKRVLERANAL